MGGRSSAGGVLGLFVGRDEEVEQVRTAARGGGPDDPATVVVISGEPGIGKSTLLRHSFQHGAPDLGARVISLRGDEAETELDYGLIDQLLRAMGHEGSDGTCPQTLGPAEAGALLLRATDALDPDRLLVVTVDDTHLVDEQSLQALTFATRRARGDRFGLVLATRPVGLRRIPAGLLRIAADTGGTLELTGLEVPDLQRMATAVYGEPVPMEAARRLHERTDGRPLHAELLVQQVGLDELTGPVEPALPSLPPLIVEQLVSCSQEGRQLLEALSVLRQPWPLGMVSALAELTDPLPAVDELAMLGLIEHVPTTPTRVELNHDLTRAAVYQSISVGRRVELHRRAAELTSGHEALHHRVAAAVEPAPKLVADLVAAADAEAERGNRHLAAHFLLTAATLAPPTERDLHLVAAGHHLLTIGRPLGEHLAAIEALPEGPRRNAVLGRSRMAEGRMHEARALLEAAWEAPGGGPALPAELRSAVAESLAVIAISSLDTDATLRWADELAQVGPTTLATTMRCHGLTLRGELDAAVAEASALVAAEPPGVIDFDARVGLGLIQVWANQVEEAIPLLASLLTGPVEHTLMRAIAARSHLADAHLRAGNLQYAMDLADLSVELLDDAEAVWLIPLPHSLAAYARAASGDLDRARHHAEVASEYARLSQDAPAMLWAEAAWLRIAEAAQDHAAAVAAGDRMLAAGLDRIAEGINPWRAIYAAALAVEGRLDDAEAVLAGLMEAVEQSPDTSVATGVAQARAIVALERGDRGTVEAALEEGLALDARLARPLPRAKLELTAGSIHRRWGQRRRAAQLLTSAAERFRLLGATQWLARCERELAGSGLQPVKRSEPVDADLLTRQERLVARLVIEGRTNRQVAEELYVSVKTVEHHLSRIYRKLNVSTRIQLATLAPDLAAAET